MITRDIIQADALQSLCEVAATLTSAESAALFLLDQRDIWLLASFSSPSEKHLAETWLHFLRQQHSEDALGRPVYGRDETMTRNADSGLVIREAGWKEGNTLVLSRHDDSDLLLLISLATPPEKQSATPEIANAGQVIVLLRAIRQLLDAPLTQSTEREQALGEYLAGLAHDLNTQFAVVLGYIHLLSEESASPDLSRHSVQVIREAMLAANGLVSPLLRSPHGMMQDEMRIELDEWLRAETPAIIRSASASPSLTLHLTAPTAVLLVSPSGLRRTLRLLINRVMEPESPQTTLRLWTELSAMQSGDGTDRHLPNAVAVPTVRIGLTSTRSAPPAGGVPLPLSAPERIPQTSVLPDFALPLSRRFASTYQGKLTISDDPDAGRTAVLELPLLPSGSVLVPEDLPQGPLSTPSPSSLSVLVIEDDGNVRNFIQQILVGRGYHVTCCGTGAEAQTLIDAGLNPEAIICDVVLPDGSGMHVMTQVAARAPAPRWLFVSGYGAESLIGRGMLDPATQFLSKPFTPDDLTNKLLELLLEREAAKQRTVLVVDDDAGIRALLRQILTGAGHHVLEAKDGKEALAILDDGSVDLLLSDLVMPSIDGVSLIKQTRLTNPRIPIIAFTGSMAASERLAAASALGTTAVVTKPIDLQALVHLIAECLHSE